MQTEFSTFAKPIESTEQEPRKVRQESNLIDMYDELDDGYTQVSYSSKYEKSEPVQKVQRKSRSDFEDSSFQRPLSAKSEESSFQAPLTKERELSSYQAPKRQASSSEPSFQGPQESSFDEYEELDGARAPVKKQEKYDLLDEYE